jgi:hypothetical protein
LFNQAFPGFLELNLFQPAKVGRLLDKVVSVNGDEHKNA